MSNNLLIGWKKRKKKENNKDKHNGKKKNEIANQFLAELSASDIAIFSFPDDDLSKNQWTFTKLGMCIDIVAVW